MASDAEEDGWLELGILGMMDQDVAVAETSPSKACDLHPIC